MLNWLFGRKKKSASPRSTRGSKYTATRRQTLVNRSAEKKAKRNARRASRQAFLNKLGSNVKYGLRRAFVNAPIAAGRALKSGANYLGNRARNTGRFVRNAGRAGTRGRNPFSGVARFNAAADAARNRNMRSAERAVAGPWWKSMFNRGKQAKKAANTIRNLQKIRKAQAYLEGVNAVHEEMRSPGHSKSPLTKKERTAVKKFMKEQTGSWPQRMAARIKAGENAYRSTRNRQKTAKKSARNSAERRFREAQGSADPFGLGQVNWSAARNRVRNNNARRLQAMNNPFRSASRSRSRSPNRSGSRSASRSRSRSPNRSSMRVSPLSSQMNIVRDPYSSFGVNTSRTRTASPPRSTPSRRNKPGRPRAPSGQGPR